MPPRTDPRPRTRDLVGRSAELAAIRVAIAKARQGVSSMIVVRGGYGTGKTALLDACARLADVSVRRASCSVNGPAALEVLVPEAPAWPATPVSYRLRAGVRQVAGDAPLVLLVDDAHLCDVGTVEILDLLVRRENRLVVVAAVDTSATEQAGLVSWGTVAARSLPLTLAPLTDDGVAEVIRQRRPPHPDPSSVAAVTGGNPLFLQLVLEQLADQPDASVAEAGAAVRASLLPSRLWTRPPHFRAVAEAVAVAGHADPDILALFSEVPEDLVHTVLAGLREDGLLDGVEPDQMRQALFGDVPPDVLRRHHARAARLLNDAGRLPGEIAPHLMALRTVDEPWMRATLRAAARDTTDHRTAIRYLEHALAADRDDTETLVDYAHSISDRAPYLAHELLWTALERATAVRDRAVLATELAWLAPATPRAASAAPVLGTALADLAGALGPHPTGPDRDLHARSTAARLAAVWGRPSAALDTPVPAGDTRAERDLLALRSFTDMLAGRSAATAADRARVVLSENGPLGWQHGLAAFVLAQADEVDAAKAGFDRVFATADPVGWTQALTRMLRALVFADAGDAPVAVADAKAAVDALENVDTARVVLATSLYRAGKAADALSLLPDRDINVPVLGDPLVLMLRATAAETDGDHTRALALSVQCGATLAEMGVEHPLITPWWVTAARLHAKAGDSRAANALVERYADVAARWGSASARGLARLAAGEVGSDVDVMCEAVELLGTTPAQWHCTHAEIALGEALLRQEDRGGARRWFRSAADRATRCGYRGVAAHVRSRLIAAGGRVRQSANGTDGGNVLSGSERRIAALAAAGATNREIAARLRVTVRTVETHLTSVYRKLGVSGRAALRELPD